MGKSIIRQRREAGAICDVCHSPDYVITPNEIKGFKPNIRCNSCGNSWQSGYDGGIYAKFYKKNND